MVQCSTLFGSASGLVRLGQRHHDSKVLDIQLLASQAIETEFGEAGFCRV